MNNKKIQPPLPRLIQDKLDFSNQLGNRNKANKQTLPQQRSLQVLLVDPNEVSVNLDKIVLTALGHSVTMAENCQEAIDALLYNDYNLIFMQVQLLEMDGLEATRFIRALAEKEDGTLKKISEIPIILLSALEFDEKYKIVCRESGINDFVLRPIDIKKLRAVIKKWS